MVDFLCIEAISRVYDIPKYSSTTRTPTFSKSRGSKPLNFHQIDRLATSSYKLRNEINFASIDIVASTKNFEFA